MKVPVLPHKILHCLYLKTFSGLSHEDNWAEGVKIPNHLLLLHIHLNKPFWIQKTNWKEEKIWAKIYPKIIKPRLETDEPLSVLQEVFKIKISSTSFSPVKVKRCTQKLHTFMAFTLASTYLGYFRADYTHFYLIPPKDILDSCLSLYPKIDLETLTNLEVAS